MLQLSFKLLKNCYNDPMTEGNSPFVESGIDTGRVKDPIVALEAANIVNEIIDDKNPNRPKKTNWLQRLWYKTSKPLSREADRQSTDALIVSAQQTISAENKQKETEQELEKDILTGLRNRKRFGQELTRITAAAKRAGQTVGLVYIDLDNFKHGVNDVFGHPHGDKVLKAFARMIESSVRQNDIPARIGGDEFAIILDNPEAETFELLKTRLMQELAKDVDGLDGLRVIGLSMGYDILSPKDQNTAQDTFISHADRAMYEAKSQLKQPGLVKLVRWIEDLDNKPIDVPKRQE